MAVPNSYDAPQADAPGQAAQASVTAQAAAPPQAKGPYDDLLCTICNLKACWMRPEAADKGGAAEQQQPQPTG